MSNLPRLKLKEEKSNLKNNDYIIFRDQSKGMSSTKNNNVNRKRHNKRTHKKRRHNKRTHNKRRKGFFSIFN